MPYSKSESIILVLYDRLDRFKSNQTKPFDGQTFTELLASDLVRSKQDGPAPEESSDDFYSRIIDLTRAVRVSVQKDLVAHTEVCRLNNFRLN